jgi:hypothetical protein
MGWPLSVKDRSPASIAPRAFISDLFTLCLLYLRGRIKKAETIAGEKLIHRIAAWSGSLQFKMIG